MKIPLYMSARPKTAARSGIVKVPAGEWVVESEGINDSQIEILSALSPLTILESNRLGLPLTISGPAYLVAEFSSRGTEEFVSVFARRLDCQPST